MLAMDIQGGRSHSLSPNPVPLRDEAPNVTFFLKGISDTCSEVQRLMRLTCECFSYAAVQLYDGRRWRLA